MIPCIGDYFLVAKVIIYSYDVPGDAQPHINTIIYCHCISYRTLSSELAN